MGGSPNEPRPAAWPVRNEPNGALGALRHRDGHNPPGGHFPERTQDRFRPPRFRKRRARRTDGRAAGGVAGSPNEPNDPRAGRNPSGRQNAARAADDSS